MYFIERQKKILCHEKKEAAGRKEEYRANQRETVISPNKRNQSLKADFGTSDGKSSADRLPIKTAFLKIHTDIRKNNFSV